ncbi:MAG: T9SS type A sorting domain-containing protein [Bacteroidota bacterium]
MNRILFFSIILLASSLRLSAQEPDTLITEINTQMPGASWKFSFIHLTDVHIGDGVKSDDYGTYSYYDNTDPSDAGLPLSILRNVMHWINLHAVDEKIKFVMITGDMTESGERSELYRFREVMDSLLVPYIPMMGNHDTWPNALLFEAPYPTGDSLINTIFLNCFSSNASLLPAWNNGTRLTHVWNPEFSCASFFQNYRFSLGSYDFVCTDFNTREPASGVYPGAMPYANINNYPGGSWPWLKNQLASATETNNTFIFTHYPLSQKPSAIASCYNATAYDSITSYAYNYRNHLAAWLSGHLHNDSVYSVIAPGLTPSVCTQYETAANSVNPGGHFRIVRVWDTLNVNAAPSLEVNNFNPQVFPNPANDELYISVIPDNYSVSEFEILDITGKVIFNEKIINSSNRPVINISRLEKGIYILRIKLEDQIICRKFVKQ